MSRLLKLFFFIFFTNSCLFEIKIHQKKTIIAFGCLLFSVFLYKSYLFFSKKDNQKNPKERPK
jgi:hypothetical protein